MNDLICNRNPQPLTPEQEQELHDIFDDFDPEVVSCVIYLGGWSDYEESCVLFCFVGLDDGLYIAEAGEGPFCSGPCLFLPFETNEVDMAEAIHEMEAMR